MNLRNLEILVLDENAVGVQGKLLFQAVEKQPNLKILGIHGNLLRFYLGKDVILVMLVQIIVLNTCYRKHIDPKD